MKTPKEKAKDLVYSLSRFRAKQCALIAVKEIILVCSFQDKNYWMQVKKEIEKL